MDDYIVKVYRRDDNDTLIGMVEDIRDRRSVTFKSREELWDILLKREPCSGGNDPDPQPSGL